ncbi:hypothetical protein [Arthrobacter sp. NPDC090010]|uniref:hypothetical protein n=1 Tax=Arthrobacter sp. NPDC090010 TaxID=3363942 RepID=UPI00381FF77C
MRLVSKTQHIYDNTVQRQYELYRNGHVMGTARYLLEGNRIVFILCETATSCTPGEQRNFFLTVLRDAQHRRLEIDVTSRAMLAELRDRQASPAISRRHAGRRVPAQL